MNIISCVGTFLACTIIGYIILKGPVPMGAIGMGGDSQITNGTIWVNNII